MSVCACYVCFSGRINICADLKCCMLRRVFIVCIFSYGLFFPRYNLPAVSVTSNTAVDSADDACCNLLELKLICTLLFDFISFLAVLTLEYVRCLFDAFSHLSSPPFNASVSTAIRAVPRSRDCVM